MKEKGLTGEIKYDFYKSPTQAGLLQILFTKRVKPKARERTNLSSSVFSGWAKACLPIYLTPRLLKNGFQEQQPLKLSRGSKSQM